ncbi:MAG TPA: hypothetical protein VGY50_10350, partial [Streptosporangiaceae bacterium]|nr:hypothetical protein [Streptosporangiaceae bacterium]
MVQGAGGEGPGGDATGVAAEDREGAGEPDVGAPADGRTGVGVPSPPSLTATIMAPRAAPPGAPPGPPPVRRPDWRRPLRSFGRALTTGPLGRHLALLACYLTVGIAVTWPRATYLVGGKLQATRDAGVYVWDFWWMAHAVEHLSNPWFTRSIVAPTGVQLGYHALMPLEGVAMMPVTVLFGPSASYNLLAILTPGLMCYAMYRLARLWLPTQTGAVFAGAFFGLSSVMAWHAWYQLNLAAGAVFLPLALEAAVRLRRQPGRKQAVILGVVLGASLLTDQESFVLVLIVVLAALVPWVVSPAWRARLTAAAQAAAVSLVVGSPQIAAMVAQTRSGGATVPAGTVATDYVYSGTKFPAIFAVSPRAVRLGLTWLKPISYGGPVLDGVLTFGLVLSVLAVAGLVVSWRRRSAWQLAALWLASAALALGAVLKIGSHTYMPLAQTWHGVRLSGLMPFTWFVQIPGMAGFREAARLTMLGVLPAALLAGAAVDWLRRRAALLLIPVLILGALEAGWAGNLAVATMPTALPALDRPIAADHSSSIVVDIPFGVRGGVPLHGEGGKFDPEAQVLATADGHPRAVGYLSRLPEPTLLAVQRNAFYAGLLSAQGGQPRGLAESVTGTRSYPALLAAASADVRRMNIGWVIVWQQSPAVLAYLASTGFRFAYAADGAWVYRPATR